MQRLSNIIGFDDSPFDRHGRGPVTIVGAVFASERLDGLLTGEVTKDGIDAGPQIAELIRTSKFYQHTQLVMLQGITLGGFNVVDIEALNQSLGIPVLVVARREPDYQAVKKALFEHLPEGELRWTLIQKAGPMEAIEDVYVQRSGLTREEAKDAIKRFSVHGHIPEPLRVAHLVAGALVRRESREGS